MASGKRRTGLRILMVGLFSERYPAAGETHGLSVIAGAVHSAFEPELAEFRVIDLVTIGKEDARLVASHVNAVRPDVLSISAPYGTYDLLLELRDTIRAHHDRGGLTLVGGALPTYIGPTILTEIDDRTVVVQGEGDRAAPAVIDAWRRREGIDAIPNVLFSQAGVVKATPRRLTDSGSVAIPYREHLRSGISRGVQVYTEASRGCSWAACTFCLRGLTDVKGTNREYRRLAGPRLEVDLRQLRDLGATQYTFADEDFLGGDSDSLSQTINLIARVKAEDPARAMTFDVSATTRSIFDESDTETENEAKASRLLRLKEVGLNKVFLGVESGSVTQLARYAKGHTPSEIIRACETVAAAGIKLELGFIMFDPLCTPAEITENCTFLIDNTLAPLVSGPTSELRLQVGSRYINVLTRTERRLGRRLFDRQVDPNTLSHAYEYADPQVAELAAGVRNWNSIVHPFVYAAKGLTRHGRGVLATSEHNLLKHTLGLYRVASLKALRAAAWSGRAARYRLDSSSALHELVSVASSVGSDSRHPMIGTLTTESAHLLTILDEHPQETV
ncbi:B12-binding domain-containing radical SAM protein [Kribbella sp. NPDC056345]|uniref:B12-binding domain-containing radical SAM protein n=1 Tax=Kribbella sp. NPDC056345 TaxID=3345789 RepID=UPI0035E3720E